MPEAVEGTIQIDKLLMAAVKGGVSDIHITTGLPPVFRIDGGMRPQKTKVLNADDTNALMKAITPERCQAELAEKGGTDFGFAFKDLARFRVSVFKQRGQVAMVLRQIPTKLLTPEQLGVPEVCKKLVTRPRGLFLVTGPTGSGKSTTLAALIDYLNDNYDHHIITIEDPIEFYHHSKKSTVNQREVGTDVPSFSEALRRALRQDPDVILVGEVRDRETAEIAMQAAMTGHFVFTTIHTNDTATTVTRLLDIGIDSSLIQSAVTAVLAQRLVRVLCKECKEPYPLPDEMRKKLRIPADKQVVVFKPKGCPACHGTGYKGRTGIHELLIFDAAIRELIVGNPSIEAIRTAARKAGMKTLHEAGLTKVSAGVTSFEEVMRVAK